VWDHSRVNSSPGRPIFALVGLVVLAVGCARATSGPQATSSTISPTTSPSLAAPASSSTGEADNNRTSPWPVDPLALENVAAWRIEIVDTIAHDSSSYTQGLELADGVLYESGGLYGESSVRKVDPATGEVTSRVDLESSLFGEGLTVVGEELVQLTWREGVALRWNRQTLDPLGRWEYEGEGWGLCLMGDRLVMSDGSDRLTWRDPGDFSAVSNVEVTLAGTPVSLINELECVGNLVVANIYTTTILVVINPEVGDIVATIDASAVLDLVPSEITDVSGNVLNGIADLGDGTLLLGGKLWPEMFTVRIVES